MSTVNTRRGWVMRGKQRKPPARPQYGKKAPEALVEIRHVALPARKKIRRKKTRRSFPGGIVAEPGAALPGVHPPAVQTADVLFPPIVPLPIAVSNGGGAIGTGLPVQVIFWGSAWNSASTSPSAGAILTA